METRVALFQQKEIRKTFHNDEWWFVITDVIAALTDSANPASYLKDMRRRDASLGELFKGGGANCPPPFATCPYGGWTAERALLEYGRHLPPHSGHPEP